MRLQLYRSMEVAFLTFVIDVCAIWETCRSEAMLLCFFLELWSDADPADDSSFHHDQPSRLLFPRTGRQARRQV